MHCKKKFKKIHTEHTCSVSLILNASPSHQPFTMEGRCYRGSCVNRTFSVTRGTSAALQHSRKHAPLFCDPLYFPNIIIKSKHRGTLALEFPFQPPSIVYFCSAHCQHAVFHGTESKGSHDSLHQPSNMTLSGNDW